MCTCGIAMATQQATPATHSSAISVLGDTPSVPRAPLDAAPAASAAMRGGAAPQQQDQRQHGDDAEQADADLGRRASRRVAMKYCTSGGQIVPAR